MRRKTIHTLSLLLALVLTVSSASGCLTLLPLACLPMQTCTVTIYETPKPTAQPEPADTPEPASSPAPTDGPAATVAPSPTDEPVSDDEARDAAVALAAEHGIPEERLFGQYSLFLRYMNAIEANASLGRYREFVIRAFPALADNAQYLNEDYFFPRLRSLVIRDVAPDDMYSGLYYTEENEILMAEEYPEEIFRTAYHEILHFIDDSMDAPPEVCRMMNGQLLTNEEYAALEGIPGVHTTTVATNNFYSECIIEGGTELFAAKYFTGAALSYSDIVSFLVGIEYIFGPDLIKNIYFSPESDVLMAKFFEDQGYSYTDVLNINRYLSWRVDPDYYYEPSIHFPLEDLLIDMYEKNVEGDWREDKRFRYILACVNGVSEIGYSESKYAEELQKSDFISYTLYDSFEWRLIRGTDVHADFYYIPPIPLIGDDSFLLCAAGVWRDPETDEVKYGSLMYDYDFETKTVLGLTTIEAEAPLED